MTSNAIGRPAETFTLFSLPVFFDEERQVFTRRRVE
jgi:hypothetical protein